MNVNVPITDPRNLLPGFVILPVGQCMLPIFDRYGETSWYITIRVWVLVEELKSKKNSFCNRLSIYIELMINSAYIYDLERVEELQFTLFV